MKLVKTVRRPKPKSEAIAAPSPRPQRLKQVRPMTLERIGGVYVKRLNDIHVATQTTIAALDRYRTEIVAEGGDDKHHNYTVPSSGRKETANIRRRKSDVSRILNALIDEGEPGKSLLLAVSVTEDFILNALKLILHAHPDRMNRGLKDGDAETTIKLHEFLAKSREEILEERIQSRLQRALHASPTEYLKYLSRVLQIQLDVDVADAFIEAKATRDILVHADGYANDRYGEKAGRLARAKTGERLKIDFAYFDGAIKAMKTLVASIHSAVQERYREDVRVNAEVGRFLA